MEVEAYVTFHYSHLSLVMSKGNKEHKFQYHNKPVLQPRVLDSLKNTLYSTFYTVNKMKGPLKITNSCDLKLFTHIPVNSTKHQHLKLRQ